MRISVIVPVFNTAEFLPAALDSLLAQEIPFFEIIAVDDASTDGSLDVLAEYKSRGVRVVQLAANGGQGRARNVGARVACGDYVYFFDSDDVAESNLVRAVSGVLLNDRSLDVVMFGGRVLRQPAVSQELLAGMRYERPGLGRFDTLLEAARSLEKSKANFSSPCLYVARTEFVKRISFEEDCFHEDDVFLLRLTASAGPTYVAPDSLFARRVRPGSTITRPKELRHLHGYMKASKVASLIAASVSAPGQREFFGRKAAQYYHQAVLMSFEIHGFSQFSSLPQRLRGLPNFNFTWREFLTLVVPHCSRRLRSAFGRIK